jgi:hypothetical protein
MMVTTDSLTAKTVGSGSDPLGRWAYQTFQGRNKILVTFISAYQVVDSSVLRGGITAAAQQYCMLADQDDPTRNPRFAFRRDLCLFLKEIASLGHDVILSGDFNEDLGSDPNGMAQILQECSLVDLFTHQHPSLSKPATYARGKSRLDYVLVSARIIESVQRCGYEPFGQRLQTDHRAYFVDFDDQILFGGHMQLLSSYARRGLKSNNLKQVTHYLREKHRLFEAKNIYERSKRLNHPGDRHQYAERLDRDILAASLAAERSIMSFEQPEWSLQLSQARRRVSTLQRILTMYRTRWDMTSQISALISTMFSATKSFCGHNCAQVFTNGLGYDMFYPLKREADAVEALNEVIRTIGVPKELVSDGAKAETQGRFAAVASEYRIKQRQTEPYSGWQNRAEAAIREIKKGIKRATLRARSPKRLWDFCGEWVSAIRRLTAHDIPSLQGRVPSEAVEGNTPDISEFVQFDWYQPVWYIDPAVQFPDDSRKLGRWIGVAHDVGSPMTFWVLPQSCKVLARSTVTSLTDDELSDPVVKARMVELDLSIKNKIGDTLVDEDIDDELADLLPHVPDDIFLADADDEPAEPDAAMPDADDFTPEGYDEYLTAEVLLPNMGAVSKAKVTGGRKRDADGNPVGKRN